MDQANRIADDLSGGMIRKLSVAIALVGDCDIIFLDEPVSIYLSIYLIFYLHLSLLLLH
jgi:ABC-type transporter Mla maintaining outer membrane lipid asymmetry ATPase subunit MlaF